MSDSLDQLPLDLLVNVFGLLLPKEIIAVRQTCKALAEVTYERTIWIESLRLTCLDNGVFQPSFPASDMSLSDIEHATTSPTRFLARLRRDIPTGTLSPLITQKLSSTDNSIFRSMALVPGGRYLLTLSSDLVVRLWDLGSSSSGIVRKEPITSLILESPDNNVRWMQTTSDGLGIRLLVHTPTDSGYFEFQIYEVYPTSAKPAFNLTSSLGVNGTFFSTGFWFAGDLIFVHESFDLTVWDIVQDKWAKFDSGQGASQLDFCNDTIIVFNQSIITMWKLPPLHPRIHGSQAPREVHLPLLHLLHRGSPENIITAAQSCHWRPYVSTKRNPYYLDVFAAGTVPAAISHYVFKVIDNSPGEGLPTCLPLVIGETLMPDEFWTTLVSPKSAWITEEDVVFFWVEGNDVKVVISNVPSKMSGLPVQRVSGLVWKHHEDADYEACPFTGRVCALTLQGDSEILVMDYLKPQS